MFVPTLTTARLRMRELSNEHFDAFARLHADPEVMRFLGGAPLSREDAWRSMAVLVGHWRLRGFGMWAVEEIDTGAFVGRVGFLQPEGWPDFELGWTIGREHWGKGYATEAARRALDYAFRDMDRTHVISLIHPDNHRSIAVAERLGETVQGEFELRGTKVKIYGVSR